MEIKKTQKPKSESGGWLFVWLILLAGVGTWRIVAWSSRDLFPGPDAISAGYVKVVDGREFLLAAGAPDDPAATWFDITDSPLDHDGYQYGVGKDSIRSIDDPVFVEPDDPRLSATFLHGDGAVDDLRVLGYAVGDEARAYPIELLNEHELVNDRVGGTPVTVGW